MSEQQINELLALLRAIADEAARVRDLLERWDAHGIPQARVSD